MTTGFSEVYEVLPPSETYQGDFASYYDTIVSSPGEYDQFKAAEKQVQLYALSVAQVGVGNSAEESIYNSGQKSNNTWTETLALVRGEMAAGYKMGKLVAGKLMNG